MNEGKQPHEEPAYKLDPGKTQADWTAWMGAAEAASAGQGAPPSGPPPASPAGGMSALNPSFTQYVYLDLNKDNEYLFVCFIPDLPPTGDMRTHWAHGMITRWPTAGTATSGSAPKGTGSTPAN